MWAEQNVEITVLLFLAGAHILFGVYICHGFVSNRKLNEEKSGEAKQNNM